MDKETVIQNLINNYGYYGVTREIIEPLLDAGRKEGFTYDLMYLQLDCELSNRYGKEFYCTSQDMARAFGLSEDEMNKVIEEAREELAEQGENPDDYFRSVPAQKFMM